MDVWEQAYREARAAGESYRDSLAIAAVAELESSKDGGKA